MTTKQAKAAVTPVRQRSQFSCMASSLAMCLRALGHEVLEDEVNRVMGARPMKGATWEQALATAQHYGCRATLTMPATVEQLKAWTDAGIPIMIAWNPEGRPWSHASVVFDVDDDLNVYVADPNMPNPKKTVRVVPEDEFYGKWYEKFPDYLVRRPACAIEREIAVTGTQIEPRTADGTTVDFRTASTRTAHGVSVKRLRDGRVVVNAGPSYQRSAKMLLEKAGWDWRLVKNVAGSWVFPKTTNVDEMMAALSELGVVKKAKQETPMQAAIWSAWDVLWGVDKVRKTNSFGWVMSSLFLGIEIMDELNGTKYARTAEKMQKKLIALKRQTRSWQATYNLWIEGKIEIDHFRLATDLGKTLTTILVIKKAVAQVAGIQRSHPEVWEQVNSHKEATVFAQRAADAFGIAVGMAQQGKMAKSKKKTTPAKVRDPNARARAEQTGSGGAGHHKNRNRDVAKGRSRKPKHKKDYAASIERLSRAFMRMANKTAQPYSGNPDGKPIYDVDVDHGEFQALAGGTDVMTRLQDEYRVEQGHEVRDPQPRLAAESPTMALRGRFLKVNQAFADGIKKMHKGYISLGYPRGGFTLIHPQADKDITFEGGSEYDFYFMPDGKGGYDVSYTLGYLMLLQDDGSKMRAKTIRMAKSRFSSDMSDEMKVAVEHVALRFMAAQLEALR